MAFTSNESLLELIPFARQLCEANEILLDRELVLRQLSLFQNLSEFMKASQSNCDQLFNIDWKIAPGWNSTESLVITIENKSDIFEFNEKFWSISTSFSNGNVQVWNFTKIFKQKDIEKFCFEYQPEFHMHLGCTPAIRERIKINLVFTIQWAAVNYTRNFVLKSFNVDVLHFVNPGRRPPAPLPLHSQMSLSQNKPNEEFRNKYPEVSKFSIRIDQKLQDIFVEKILLKDSFVSRGFAQEDLRSEFLASVKEFHFYYYDTKLICSKEANDTVWFHCTNPRVLHLVKDAVYTRLIELCESRIVRIKCADVEKNSDLLYQVKLQLESLVVNPEVQFPQVLEIYFKFREMSESVLSFVCNR